MELGCRDLIVLALAVLAGTALAAATFHLAFEQYPPVDWETTAFTGTIVGLQGGPKGKQHIWAIVLTDDGTRRRMPIDEHNGIPGGGRVRKVAGEVHVHVQYPGGERTIRPMENPGFSLFPGIAWWGLWCGVFGATSLIVSCRRQRRGQDDPMCDDPRPHG